MVNLFDLLEGEDPGGVWVQLQSGDPIDISDPTNVDFTGATQAKYIFQYTVTASNCSDVETVGIIVTACANLCSTMVANSATQLIEFDMTNLPTITESVTCSSISTYSDVALTPEGTLFASSGTNLIEIDYSTNPCTTTSTTNIGGTPGPGLSHFSEANLMISDDVGTNPNLGLYTVDYNTAVKTLWADSGLLRSTHTISGDFILLNNKLYATIRNTSVSPAVIDLYRFGIDNNLNWDNTITNLGTLPTGGGKYWGLALIEDTIYAVDGLTIVQIDISNPPASSVVFTSTLANSDLRGAASIEDGSNVC